MYCKLEVFVWMDRFCTTFRLNYSYSLQMYIYQLKGDSHSWQPLQLKFTSLVNLTAFWFRAIAALEGSIWVQCPPFMTSYSVIKVGLSCLLRKGSPALAVNIGPHSIYYYTILKQSCSLRPKSQFVVVPQGDATIILRFLDF